MRKQPKYVYGLYNKARTNDYKSSADKLKIGQERDSGKSNQ